MLRQENGGICNPESCPEFQTRKCNLSGRFIFFIPSIKSIDAFELHTNSFYAMSRAIEQFETAFVNARAAVHVLEGAADATYGRATPSPGANDISEEQVIAAVGEFGIGAARYEAYAAKRWEPGWKLNANGRRRALGEIERYRNDPEGLADKIDTELHAHTGACTAVVIGEAGVTASERREQT